MTAFPAKHQKFQAAMKNGLMNFISATKATKPRRKPHLRLVDVVVTADDGPAKGPDNRSGDRGRDAVEA
jgi:hypothetical protein